MAPPLVVGPTRSWQITAPCLVNTPYPSAGLKKAIAVSDSLADTGVLVEVVDGGVVVRWGAGGATDEGDAEQPAIRKTGIAARAAAVNRRVCMIISRTYGPARCHNFDSAGYVEVGCTGALRLAAPDCRQGIP